MHFPTGLLTLAAVVATTVTGVAPPDPVSAQGQPNIVLINLDDADYDLIDDPALDAYFPNIRTHLRDAGLRLSNLHVSTPLCGPSRAALLRSQYAHNTGVLTNAPTPNFTGGFGQSYDNGYTNDELGRWMQDAGYTTMLVGKYLHEGFPHLSGDNRYRPPGWDEFYATRGGRYYGFTQLINGQLVGPTAGYPDEFRTDVEAQQAVDLLRSHQSESDPMFLYLAPYAPHESTTTPIYAARHANLFNNVGVPRTPDFNEADMSDKPDQIAALPPYQAAGINNLDDLYRRRLRSMKAVDDMVGSLVTELNATGELNNTIIMLTSDNGFSLGHNRLAAKQLPYDRMTRVGMLVRGPGVPAGVEANHLLSHVDIAPTIVDLAGGAVPGWSDGQSFAPILFSPSQIPITATRQWIVIENWGNKNHRGVILNGRYRAVRGPTSVYVEWADGGREHYDLSADPFQLDNRYDELSGFERYWGAILLRHLFSTCSGPGCNQSGIANQPPDTTVTEPAPEAPVSTPLMIRGQAHDDRGVSRVEIIVRNRANSRYWNGQGFQTGFASVDAPLAAPGAASTSFETQITTPNVDLDIFARAVDSDGTSDPVVPVIHQNHTPDVIAPTTLLQQPTNGGVITGPLVFSGTATDNFDVADVLLVIKDRTNNTFWNGTTFQATFTRVPAVLTNPGQSQTPFGYQASIPDGPYTVTARAYDGSGNYTDPPPVAHVTVANQP